MPVRFDFNLFGWQNGNQRDLLQGWVSSFFIRFTLRGFQLLDGGSGRRYALEVFCVDLVHGLEISHIVKIDVGRNDMAEIHPRFLEVVEQVSHGLTKLVVDGGGEYSSIRSWNKAALG